MIALILACDLDGAIGRDGGLPWGDPIRADMSRFLELTLLHRVVMGRRTWDSLPVRPLPHRENVVMSGYESASRRNPDVWGGAIWCGDLETAMIPPPDGRVYVIGGESVFRQALPLAHRVHLTLVHGRYGGDRYFPLDYLLEGRDGWREARREDVPGRPLMPVYGFEPGHGLVQPALTFIDFERDRPA